MPTLTPQHLRETSRTIGRIPVRNIWFLYLYASNLAKFRGRFDAEIEESADFPELVARLLCRAVELRLRRNLSRNYRTREAVLSRVRGRIDILKTVSEELLAQGKIACRFDELTIDTSRNRLVRAALDTLASIVGDRALSHRCKQLATGLANMGVSRVRPSRSEIKSDRIGRNDSEDALMVALAAIVFDLVLPTEEAGRNSLTNAEKDEIAVRHLFEKAIGNFLAAELSHNRAYRVIAGQQLQWPIDAKSDGISAILPGMKTDIVIENASLSSRTVIDTKFTSILGRNAYQKEVLKSGYLYQMYAYLRSQENPQSGISLNADGLFIHPTIDCDLDETVQIQGHKIRFVTIDLALPTADIVTTLRSAIVHRHIAQGENVR